MASDKKVILVFTPCDGKSAVSASTPALSKLLQKGALFTHVKNESDVKTLAATGTYEGESGESLWDAAVVETTMAEVLEAADRSTLIVPVASGAIVFHGPGIAKGKVVNSEICPCCVAPTVAYVANFPVPAQCDAPVAYAALKDINLKLREFQKLQETITNMEAAMERKSRQPWDKHDCA